MAYDGRLAQRVREELAERPGYAEKKMFGGLCFLLRGNMCCGVGQDGLMVRVGPEQYESALADDHARQMDFTGRPMKGFVFVNPAGHKTAKGLKTWIDRGARFALSLPAK